MKLKIILFLICVFVVSGTSPIAGEKMLSLSEIMDKVEKRYDGPDFSAYFI